MIERIESDSEIDLLRMYDSKSTFY